VLFKRFKKLIYWFDQHGLFSLSLFLLVFIPLYPKLPLFEAIPGYLVKVRLEDILVFLTGVFWLIQLLRKKIAWHTSYHWLIIGYTLVGFLSLLVAINLQQTIPAQLLHISKSALHYFRYLEYFSLFFFMFAGIKSKLHLQISLATIVLILNLVFIYGFGQRYLHWPAFSTMNREYSKGQSLILNPTDKLQSTFGGHYDMAAWLVLIMPLLVAWFLYSPSKRTKSWLGLSLLAGSWLLLESGSKTALAACLIAMTIPVWYFLGHRWGKVKANLTIVGAGILLSTIVFISLWLWQRPTLYKLAPFLRSAQHQTPIDATSLADETWSENARKYGLSMGIRLDTLWPQALEGFSLNPWTGKGYATLNKKGVAEFNEADSTDNNFLRALGETGLLGFIILFSLIVLITKTLTNSLPQKLPSQALAVGFIGSTVGLLINAFIIDVFAASKVAFSYWALAGLTIKSLYLKQPQKMALLDQKRIQRLTLFWNKNWPIILASIGLILLVHKRPLTEYSLVKSFALAPQKSTYMAQTTCLAQNNNWQQCLTKYQLGLSGTYSLYLLPFYLIHSDPAMYYFANLILIIGSATLFGLLIKKLFSNSTSQFLLLTIIFTTPALYNLPSKSKPANLYLFLILVIANLVLTKFFANNFSIKVKLPYSPKLVNLGLLLITLTHLMLVQYFIHAGEGILASFRDTYRPSSYVAIRRANRLFGSRAKADHLQPILLHQIEPTLFDIYGDSFYQIKSLENSSPEQSMLDLDQLNSPELFITNANLDQNLAAKAVFEKYKHQFGIKLKDIDCRHDCNYYQLLAQEIEIPTQPLSWNQDPLIINENYSFAVIDNHIISHLGVSKYLSHDQEVLKQILTEKELDFIFLAGESGENLEKNWGGLFMQRLDPALDAPIISVLSGYSSKDHSSFGPQHQLFSIDSSWFVTLDAASHHSSPAQNIFLYDALLQLEKHPEIKNIFIISHDSSWLESHPDNYYFWEDFPKALQKYPKVKFNFIFNSPLEPDTIEEIRLRLPDNSKLIAPPKGEDPFNDYLQIRISPLEVEISSNRLIK
jgi:hypothetical protein